VKASAPAPKQNDKALDPRAFTLNEEALDLYRAGEYRKAVAKLEKALELHPDAKELLYNLGVVYEKLAEPEPAIRYYKRYVEVETVPKSRERAESALRRLEGAKKDLQRATPPPGSAPPPPPRRSDRPPPSPLLLVGAGATGTALLLGTVFGLAAFFTQPTGKLVTGGGVTYQELLDRAESAHSSAITADVFFGIGIATGAATLIAYLVVRPGPTRPSPPAVQLPVVSLEKRPGPSALGLGVRF